MRNLKKILALVLALVMSLSLMATASAAGTAAATDAATAYKTAIDVLTGLKVVIGDAGGIRPDDYITRAEAATLIYRVHTADVTDSKVYLHTDHPFTDVASTSWMNSYVSYAHNAQIVKGRTKVVNGTTTSIFDPTANITGYETLAMTLRALGYGKNGEFEGGEWKIQTAAWSQRIGLFNGISAADSTDYALNKNASRGFVFQVMFNAVLMDQVAYSAYTPDGYSSTGKSMADGLGLEDLTGVVVANRIADLYDTDPLADGKTRMNVDGKDYTLNIDTDATAIGLTHHAYVKGGEVLSDLVVSDVNVVAAPDHGEASKVADLAKGQNIKTNEDTEYFLNFDPVLKDTSDWRIEYKAPKSLVDGTIRLEYSDAQLIANGCEWDDENGMWTKLIRVGNKITAMDLAILQEIFEYDSKGIEGKVYAGTDTKTDRSDEMSWKTFRKEFLNIDEKDTITSSDNGEWLRVIDNNGDGIVDYVLRTDFVMTTITDYEKRTDVYDVEWNGGLPNGNGEGKIPASAIVKASEDTDLSVGSVILYTLIDGSYYVSNPEVETLKIDKKGIDSKKGTFISNSETYTWSGIEEEAVRYYDSVSQLGYETTYEMYPDHFGFIRLATESSRNFVLLTDGYYYTDNRNPEYKADLWNGETFVEGVDVADHGERDLYYDDDGVTVTREEGFIDTFEADHKGNAGTWKRLNTFGEFYNLVDTNGASTWVHYVDAEDGPTSAGTNYYYDDPFVTNIALGSETDGKWTLEDVENLDADYNGLYRDYKAYELAGTNITYNSSVKQRSLTAKSTDLWGVTAWNGNTPITEQAIQTNGQTLYYLVTDPGSKDQSVKSWVGYKNMPEDLGKDITPVRAYAVTHEVADADAHYVIADVVVLEGVYGKTSANPQLIINGVTPKREIALGRDGDGVYGEHDTEYGLFTRDQLRSIPTDDNGVPYGKDGLVGPQVSFYDPNAGDYILSNFASYGIYAGFVTVITETKNSDYIELTPSGSVYDKRYSFETDEVVVFELDQDTGYDGNATKNLNADKHENIKMGDQLIVMCDADDNVKLVVNVSRSGKDGNPYRDGNGNWDDKYVIQKLLDLHDYIVAEQKDNSKTVAEKLAEAKAVWNKRDDSENPALAGELEAALDLLHTITNNEINSMTHGDYDSYTEMVNGLPGAINNAVVAEETSDALAALYQYAGDAIFEVIGNSWDELPNGLPEGVDSYEDLMDYDFASDENLSETQINQIEAIVTAVETAETSMDGISIPSEAQDASVPEQVASIHDNIVDILDDAVNAIDGASAGAPEEVEDNTMVPTGVPADVTVERKDDADEIVENHENVTNAYEVTIPAEYGKNVKFEISVPEGQTPYVDDDTLPSGVTSVTFTKKAAQTLATVSAVTWEVEIVVDTESQSSEAVVDILLLDDGSAPVEKPLTVDVEAVTARLWDVEKGGDDKSANNLYSSYSVSMTEGTEENTWDVSIKARDVVKHQNASNTEGYWVGVAFLPTASKGTVTNAALYIANAETGALTVDSDCTFGPALIEVTGGKGEEVENLIAEYFSCDASSNADFSKTYKVVVQWTVTDDDGAETTVRHTYNVSVDITKQLTAADAAE